MRIFLAKGFVVRKDRPSDGALRAAITEIQAGLVDAHLGGELVKKRVAGKGKGKSGAYRAIIAVRARKRVFVLHSFAKAERSTLTAHELAALKRLSAMLMGYTEHELDQAVKEGALVEISNNDEGK